MIRRQPRMISRAIPYEFQKYSYRSLMELGFDTLEIADCKGIAEADVYNTLARERGLTVYCSRRGASLMRQYMEN